MIYIQIFDNGNVQVPICAVKETVEGYTGTKDQAGAFSVIGTDDGAQEVDWKGNMESRNIYIEDIRNGRWLWDTTYSRFVLNPEQDKLETSIDVYIDWEPT